MKLIFEEIQAHSYEEEFQLSSAAVDELWSLVVLCLFFCTDLRAAASTEFSLVDASGEWKAEVTTKYLICFGFRVGKAQADESSLVSPSIPLASSTAFAWDIKACRRSS